MNKMKSTGKPHKSVWLDVLFPKNLKIATKQIHKNIKCLHIKRNMKYNCFKTKKSLKIYAYWKYYRKGITSKTGEEDCRAEWSKGRSSRFKHVTSPNGNFDPYLPALPITGKTIDQLSFDVLIPVDKFNNYKVN